MPANYDDDERTPRRYWTIVRSALLLKARGVTPRDIALALDVSESTVRRDLKAARLDVSEELLNDKLSAVVAEYWAVIIEARASALERG